MIPKSGNRFPACAKPRQTFVLPFDASAGEGRSEKIMLKQKSWSGIAIQRNLIAL
jgi:hypothetical protein